jgi:hypothetical protein
MRIVADRTGASGRRQRQLADKAGPRRRAIHHDAVRMRVLVAGIVAAVFLLVAGTARAPVFHAVRAARSCFGAAALDPANQPCKTTRTVTPSPELALIEPSAPCTPVQLRGPEVCAFGVDARHATGTFALVGDSHAVHWRAALAVVAAAKHWHGYSIYRSRCPFIAARKSTPKPDSTQCVAWNRRVLAWFRHHPEVTTVFVSQRYGVGVVPRPGMGSYDTKVAALADAWKSLPGSVRHVVAIRDVPYNTDASMPCVERAIRRHRNAAKDCALPRAEALHDDPALAAAAQIGPPKAQAIDLSDFMCTRTQCPPVIGGVLVHKDRGHLTRVFSTTLGPYLLHDLNVLMRAWS